MPTPRTYSDCPHCKHHTFWGVPAYMCPLCKKTFCKKCMIKPWLWLFGTHRCPLCTASINPEKDALNM